MAIIYIKIIDPYKASYGIDDYKYSILKLIESRLNLQIGKLELSKILKNRELLNDLIVKIINEAAMENWGIECIRFEIKELSPQMLWIIILINLSIYKNNNSTSGDTIQ